MKKYILILTIFLLFILCSCDDNKEIHEVSFVSSIGIDYNIDTEEYHLFLYFINTINNVSVDYGLSEPEKLGFTAKGTGKTINEALMNIQAYTETHLNLKHLESVIFSEPFFTKKNIFEFYYFCRNSHLLYHTFEIFVTDSDMKELFLVENMTDSPSYYTILTGKKAGFDYHQRTFLNFCTDILTPNYYILYPKITIKEDIYHKNDTSYKTIGVTGYSILKEDYQLSTYEERSLPGIKFLDSFTVFTTSINNLTFSIKNYQMNKNIIDKILNIDITYEITIFNNPQNLSENQVRDIVAKHVISELNTVITIMRDDQIDILNIDFLNQGRGKLAYDLTYKEIEISYDIKSYCGK